MQHRDLDQLQVQLQDLLSLCARLKQLPEPLSELDRDILLADLRQAYRLCLASPIPLAPPSVQEVAAPVQAPPPPPVQEEQPPQVLSRKRVLVFEDEEKPKPPLPSHNPFLNEAPEPPVVQAPPVIEETPPQGEPFLPPVVETPPPVVQAPPVIEETPPQGEPFLPPVVEAPPPVVQAPPVIEETPPQGEPFLPPVVETPPPVVQAPPIPAVQEEVPTASSGDLDPEYDELFSFKEPTDLSERLAQTPIHDIQAKIGLNERMLFISQLFGHDAALFMQVVTKLNVMNNMQEARAYLEPLIAKPKDWLHKDRKFKAKEFLKLVNRRYIKPSSN